MTSACGELPAANAVYCTADQQIYYSIDLVRAFPQVVRTMRFLAASVMAHEFAHAVQFRTMILMSQEVLSYTAEEVAEQRELSRRLEMQADCFSGLFLRAVADSTSLTASDERDIATIFAVLGGTEPGADDHGLGVNRAAWATTGLSTLDVGVCQTFSADPDTVS
jgi:predicted metalloprotease